MIEEPREDRQLVDAVIAGDQSAFRTLVDRESRVVIAACQRVLGDRSEAEDAAQDAFLRAYRAIATFRGDGPFGAWLRRIAIRGAVARLAARHDVVRLDPDAMDQQAAITSGDDPEVEILGVEERAALVEALATLPAHQREVILLRFYRDLTLEEIAELTGQPIGTVKSRMHRGVAGLRQRIAPRTAP